MTTARIALLKQLATEAEEVNGEITAEMDKILGQLPALARWAALAIARQRVADRRAGVVRMDTDHTGAIAAAEESAYSHSDGAHQNV